MGEAALITGLAGATKDEGVETPTARATRRLLRRKGAAFGLFVIALFVALALLAPLISPYDPNLDLERRAEGAVGIALVRHRRCRTGRARARNLWRARLAAGGCHLGRDRAFGRRADRRHLRLR